MDKKIQSNERGFSIQFKNGYGISVVTHPLAYCTDETAEIAVLKGNELVDPSIIGENWGDQVLGHVSADRIADYITKIKSIEEDR